VEGKMIVYKCDLCGEIKECLQKPIDQKEYDICGDCWNALQVKLKGKGRPTRGKEAVLLPTPGRSGEREGEASKPMPGEPPKIWSRRDRAN
jgi:predicted nucleic acid-binding Zn ribbon protein